MYKYSFYCQGMWCGNESGRQGAPDSLALQQHVGLPEQGHLWPQAPLAVGQVADVTLQLVLALSAALQLRLQPPQLLLQPNSRNKNTKQAGFFKRRARSVGTRVAALPYLICSVW